MRTRSVRACLALSFAAAGLVCSTVFGQVAGPSWVALDTRPAGTPPSVVVDRANSNEDQTVFNITIHGFFTQQVSLPGIGSFQRISLNLDGLGAKTLTPGRPELPVLNLQLAIPTDAASLATPLVTVQSSSSFSQLDVLPSQPDFLEEEDVPPVAPAPQIDAAFYMQNTTFPAAAGIVLDTPSEFHGVKTQRVNVNLFRVNPGLRSLTVNRQVQVIIAHNGNALPQVELTRRTNRGMAQMVDNWLSVLGSYVVANPVEYKGEYLIICPSTWLDEIDPLRQQKAERGYNVTVTTTESIGSEWLQYWFAIFNWRNSRPAGSDKYVLLVGDTNRIPLGLNILTGEQTSDYVYASYYLALQAVEPYVFLGRFSVSSSNELTRLVDRTIKHIDDPVSSTRWDNCLLAAHNQTGNGYVDCIEDIEGVNYVLTNPQFTMRRGSSSAGTVANTLNDIAVGQAVILYRGHGGRFSWSDWDFNHESLTDGDVYNVSLSDSRPSPFVMSVSCTNSRIDAGNGACIAEAWIRKSGNGAVGHIGATRATWTSANHTYARSLAFGIYFLPLTPTASWVLDFAGGSMAGEHGGDGWENRYLYHLLGDPELPLYRSDPATSSFGAGAALRGGLPEWLPPGQHTLNLTFADEGGVAIDQAIVSAYKAEEVQVNGYTDVNGEIALTVNPSTCGELVVRAYSDFESVRGQRFVIPIAILGDADRNGFVEFPDIVSVLQRWGTSYTQLLGAGDADFNRRVDFADVATVLRAWGNRCD